MQHFLFTVTQCNDLCPLFFAGTKLPLQFSAKPRCSESHDKNDSLKSMAKRKSSDPVGPPLKLNDEKSLVFYALSIKPPPSKTSNQKRKKNRNNMAAKKRRKRKNKKYGRKSSKKSSNSFLPVVVINSDENIEYVDEDDKKTVYVTNHHHHHRPKSNHRSYYDDYHQRPQPRQQSYQPSETSYYFIKNDGDSMAKSGSQRFMSRSGDLPQAIGSMFGSSSDQQARSSSYDAREIIIP